MRSANVRMKTKIATSRAFIMKIGSHLTITGVRIEACSVFEVAA
jgi:hypothetical protein